MCKLCSKQPALKKFLIFLKARHRRRELLYRFMFWLDPVVTLDLRPLPGIKVGLRYR